MVVSVKPQCSATLMVAYFTTVQCDTDSVVTRYLMMQSLCLDNLAPAIVSLFQIILKNDSCKYLAQCPPHKQNEYC